MTAMIAIVRNDSSNSVLIPGIRPSTSAIITMSMKKRTITTRQLIRRLRRLRSLGLVAEVASWVIGWAPGDPLS